MKTFAFVLVPFIFIFTSFFLFKSSQNNSASDRINSILGDISFVSKFGHEPASGTNENLRIRTHLEYVENLLRNKDVSGMSYEQLEKRDHLLDLLHEYHSVGIFPVNYDYEERRPCFIDKDGKICAVGYLIEKTAGKQTAEEINENHKYDLISDMDNETVREWITNSGLTLEECAMIQPGYGYENSLKNDEALFTASLLAANLTFNVLNGIEISNRTDGTVTPYIGMLSGVTQLIYGIANYPKRHYDYSNDNEDKVLSAVNIGVGASAFILSLWNAIDKEKVTDKKTSWNIYSKPEKEKKLNIGIALKHTF